MALKEPSSASESVFCRDEDKMESKNNRRMTHVLTKEEIMFNLDTSDIQNLPEDEIIEESEDDEEDLSGKQNKALSPEEVAKLITEMDLNELEKDKDETQKETNVQEKEKNQGTKKKALPTKKVTKPTAKTNKKVKDEPLIAPTNLTDEIDSELKSKKAKKHKVESTEENKNLLKPEPQKSVGETKAKPLRSKKEQPKEEHLLEPNAEERIDIEKESKSNKTRNKKQVSSKDEVPLINAQDDLKSKKTKKGKGDQPLKEEALNQVTNNKLTKEEQKKQNIVDKVESKSSKSDSKEKVENEKPENGKEKKTQSSRKKGAIEPEHTVDEKDTKNKTTKPVGGKQKNTALNSKENSEFTNIQINDNTEKEDTTSGRPKRNVQKKVYAEMPSLPDDDRKAKSKAKPQQKKEKEIAVEKEKKLLGEHKEEAVKKRTTRNK